MTHKSWGSTVSDTDSVGGGSGLGSPTTSTGTTSCHDYLKNILHVFGICINCFILFINFFLGDISKIARTSSTGTMSSNEDADEKDSNVTSFETPSERKPCTDVFRSNLCVSSSFWLSVQHFADINGIEPEIVVHTGPFRNVGLSKAAQTHKLRKLRSPSKCRECDSYVYFQGAECEEVSHVCCAWPRVWNEPGLLKG